MTRESNEYTQSKPDEQLRLSNANLVLLDKNPTASVQNLHTVSAFVRGGRYYSGEELAAMRENVAQRLAAA